MANLSSAFGEIIIKKEDVLGCREVLVDYLKDYKEPYYGVHWTPAGPDLIEAGGDKDVHITFWGTGRWTFDACANDWDWFFNTEENPKAKELLDYFSDRDTSIGLSFVDEECGNEVLYSFCGEYYFPEKGTAVLGGDYEDFDYTSANLVELNCYACECDVEDDGDVMSLAEDYAKSRNYGVVDDRLLEAVREAMNSPRYGGCLVEPDLYIFDEDVDVYLEG